MKNDQEARVALDLIQSGEFDGDEPGLFHPLLDILLHHGDYYMHLADLKSYMETQQRVGDFYQQPEAWAQRAWLNIAAAGPFSSDRTVQDYARDVWNVCPVEVDLIIGLRLVVMNSLGLLLAFTQP